MFILISLSTPHLAPAALHVPSRDPPAVAHVPDPPPEALRAREESQATGANKAWKRVKDAVKALTSSTTCERERERERERGKEREGRSGDGCYICHMEESIGEAGRVGKR